MFPLPARDANRTRARTLCWCLAYNLRRVTAVEIIFERSTVFLFEQSPVRSFNQQLLHSLFVLFRLEPARAVNKPAAGLEQSRSRSHDLELLAPDLSHATRS